MHVTVAHPSLVPDRPTGPYAEARNLANSLGQTPLEQPSPAPTASTPESASTEGSSPVSVMPDLPATSTRKPAAEPSQPTPPYPSARPVFENSQPGWTCEACSILSALTFVSVSFHFTMQWSEKKLLESCKLISMANILLLSFCTGEESVNV